MAQGGIRFQRPVLPAPAEIEHYLGASREIRWFSNFGPCSELLRTRLTESTGRSCVPVANATLGLILAVAALTRERGPDAREGVVPSFAFAASAQAAVWNGLTPVFVDIGEEHWHLGPESLEAALRGRQGRVAVVIALSAFGVPPPPAVRDGWEALCKDHGVPLLVDSAAGYGASAADGVPIGAQGEVEVVSFHATKPLPAGEGGAIFCRDADLAAEITALANFSFDENHEVRHANGLNAKLSEPSAAIALASLDHLAPSLATRRELAEELLGLLPPEMQRQEGGALGTWQFVPVAAPDSSSREAVLEQAERTNIGVRTYYDPLHLMPGFAGCPKADALAVTERVASRMLSLPMALELGRHDLDAIADVVRLGIARRGSSLASTGPL